MGNIGNVAMDTCIICKEAYQLLLQNREGTDQFKGKREVCTGGICDKCQETIDGGVQLFCDSCHGFQVLKAGTLGLPAGTKNKIFCCTGCTKEKYGKDGFKLFNEGNDSDFVLFSND